MHRALVSTVMLVALACGGSGGQATTQSRPIRGPADRISEAEINAGVYQNALEVVRNLRPGMLIPRGAAPDASGLGAASIPIMVYMDDVRLGDIGSMVNIPAGRVVEIRFINARDATTRYGTGHGSGVILVTTKR